jgi:hypothetical protein
MPEPRTAASYTPPPANTMLRPAMFKHVGAGDKSRDLSSIDVDVRRINYLRNVC